MESHGIQSKNLPLWLLLLISALLSPLALFLLFKTSTHYVNLGSDFVQDYYAAKALQEGRSIYSSAVTELAQKDWGLRGFENFHPPFVAILYQPLTLLTYDQANYFWSLLSLISYCLVIIIAWKESKRPFKFLLLILPLALFWQPFIENIALGQSSILIALIVCLSWSALECKFEKIAGSLLALVCLLKLFPGLLVLQLIFDRRWRALKSFIITALVGLSLVYIFIGPEDLPRYIFEIAPRDVREWAVFPANLSLWGNFAPLINSNHWVATITELPTSLSLIFELFAITIGAYGAYQACAKSRPDLSYSLLIVTMLVASPITWSHAFVILILPIAMLNRELPSANRKLLLYILVGLSLPTYEIIRVLQSYSPIRQLSWQLFLLTRLGAVSLLLTWIIALKAAICNNNEKP